MAKAKPKAVNVTGNGNSKCGCNPVWSVVSWILGALGLWALVGGFATQFSSANPVAVNTTVLVWYFAGLLLVSLAKISKWKACGCCSAHSGMMK